MRRLKIIETASSRPGPQGWAGRARLTSVSKRRNQAWTALLSTACCAGGGDGPSTAVAKAVNAALLFSTVATAVSRSARKLWKSTIAGPPSIRYWMPPELIWRVWQAAQVIPTMVRSPEPLTVKPTGRPGVGLAGLGR